MITRLCSWFIILIYWEFWWLLLTHPFSLLIIQLLLETTKQKWLIGWHHQVLLVRALAPSGPGAQLLLPSLCWCWMMLQCLMVDVWAWFGSVHSFSLLFFVSWKTPREQIAEVSKAALLLWQPDIGCLAGHANDIYLVTWWVSKKSTPCSVWSLTQGAMGQY